MPKVRIIHSQTETTVQAPAGSSLLAAIQSAGLSVTAPCGGARRCGKCLVQATGSLSAPTEGELPFLEGQPPGTRLACCALATGECEVRLPEKAEAVIENAYTPWQGALAPLYEGGVGAAVDIGTTTVAAQLFCPGEKRPVAVLGEMNAQQPFGADVLTRIVHCNENTVAPLRDIIRKQLASMLAALCEQAGVPTSQLRYLVAAGNSVMMYILAGYEPRPLGLVPFTLQHRFGAEYELDLPGFSGLRTYIPGCVSAYVGADITCSVLASGIAGAPGNLLLIDAGTNGEMALCSGGRLTCCSTAAGPAFEGAGISCGGSAALGAIDSVDYQNGEFRFTTIGGAPPIVLCGSGLIDAAAALLDAGLVDEGGALASSCGGKVALGASPVSLSQGDIRQLQLAKAAIRAGMDTLLHECGVSYAQLDGIILCGGFGSYLRPTSAQRIGLIPPGTAGKTRALGNAAGNGAAQILQSRQKQQQAAATAAQMQVVELSTSPYFMSRFMETMGFEEA